jgi:hypothetical protein
LEAKDTRDLVSFLQLGGKPKGHVYFFEGMTGGFFHGKGLQKGIIVISNPTSLLDRRDNGGR